MALCFSFDGRLRSKDRFEASMPLCQLFLTLNQLGNLPLHELLIK